MMKNAAALKSRGMDKEVDSVAEFLGFILNHDPNSRPTIEQIIERLPNRPVYRVKDDTDNGARGSSVTSFLLVVFLVL
jgi:hypothetical protein